VLLEISMRREPGKNMETNKNLKKTWKEPGENLIRT